VSRLQISDQVRALLPTPVVERVIAARQHTDIICPACRITITPKDPAIVSVSVAVDSGSDHMRLVLAHAACQPSIVISAQLPDGIDWRFSYRMFVRDHASLPCVLVWEPITIAVLPDASSTVNVLVYSRQGFAASPDGVRYTQPPVLRGWMLRNRGEDLVLHSPDGEAEDFTLALDGDPERAA